MSPPAGPRVGVGGVLIHAGQVLLVRRAQPPLQGRWSIPGGKVEWGETLQQAVARELLEETGLRVRVGALLIVFDRLERTGDDVLSHYVVIDYLCELEGGLLRAGSDALEAAFAARDELSAFDLPPLALEVIRDAFARVARAPVTETMDTEPGDFRRGV